MSKLLAVALLLLPLTNHRIYLATAWDDKAFFKYCPPSQCSQHGPEIRYPLCLESSNTSSSSCGCGERSTRKLGRSTRKLACSGEDTILVHPVLGPYNVSAIDYRRSSMKIIPLANPCLVLQHKFILSRTSSLQEAELHFYNNFYWTSAILVCCSREFRPGAADSITGPVSCLSNTTHFFYLAFVYEDMSLLPLDCKVAPDSDSSGRRIPMHIFDDPMSDTHSQSFKENAEGILSFAERTVYWQDYTCGECELYGRCAFSSQRNETFCIPDPHGMISSNLVRCYVN